MYTYCHGGDVAGYEAAYGQKPLDFSANTSPLGIPASVREAAAASLAQADRYPDPFCRALCAAIGRVEGVPADWVLCGNGAADLLFRAVLAVRPKRALLLAPTFAEYEQALRLCDCQLNFYTLHAENQFVPQTDLLDAIMPELDMLFLCEPNNPSGRVTPPALLDAVVARCRETGTLLVCDECFGAFLEQPHSLTAQLAQNQNLLVLKAFTKLYGMAGLRLGYCLSANTGLLDCMRAAGQPWPVSTPAQAAGLAALEDSAYADRVRALVRAEAPFLWNGLRHLGLSPIQPLANYILFSAPCNDLAVRCRRHGILIRDCSNYRGLTLGWYRVAVRTHAENEKLLAVLRTALEEG